MLTERETFLQIFIDFTEEDTERSMAHLISKLKGDYSLTLKLRSGDKHLSKSSMKEKNVKVVK